MISPNAVAQGKPTGREEGDNLRNDKGQDPGTEKDGSPRKPTSHGVLVDVASSLEQTEVDEPSRDGGIQDTQEDQGRNHEGERHLLEHLVADGTECRGSHILVTRVVVNDSTDNAEDEDLGNGTGPERLREVAGILHLGDETGQGDLADEGVADVKESVETHDEGGSGHGDGGDDGFAELHRVIPGRVVHDAGEDGGQEDRDEGEDRRPGADLGKTVECAWQRADPADNHDDYAEADGTACNRVVLGHGVEVLGANKDMETLDEL